MTSIEDPAPIALLPAAIAGILAALGVAGMIALFVSAEQIPEGTVGMRSANAVHRAGATITPTSPNAARLSNPSSIILVDEVRKDP